MAGRKLKAVEPAALQWLWTGDPQVDAMQAFRVEHSAICRTILRIDKLASDPKVPENIPAPIKRFLLETIDDLADVAGKLKDLFKAVDPICREMQERPHRRIKAAYLLKDRAGRAAVRTKMARASKGEREEWRLAMRAKPTEDDMRTMRASRDRALAAAGGRA
jgi:hypothetical protein